MQHVYNAAHVNISAYVNWGGILHITEPVFNTDELRLWRCETEVRNTTQRETSVVSLNSFHLFRISWKDELMWRASYSSLITEMYIYYME